MMITFAERFSVAMVLMAKMLLMCVMILSCVVDYEVKSAAVHTPNHGQFDTIFNTTKQALFC